MVDAAETIGKQNAETSRMNNELSVGDTGDLTTLDLYTDTVDIWNCRIKEFKDSLAIGSSIIGLTGWWPLNSNLLDYSINENDAYWTGSETYTLGLQFPKSGDLFDGSQRINTTSSDVYTNAFSISFWLKRMAGSSTGTTNCVGFGSYQKGFWTDGSDQFAFEVNDGSRRGANRISITLNFAIGSWVHVVGTADGTTGSMFYYINNVERGHNYSLGSPLTIYSDLRIDPMGNTSEDSHITDVRLYDRALTGSEINLLYNDGKGITYNASSLIFGHPDNGIWGLQIWGLDPYSRFILGHPDLGILGTSVLGEGIVPVPELIGVHNAENNFIEPFGNDRFIALESTGSWDYTNNEYYLAQDDYLLSEYVVKNGNTYTSIYLNIVSQYVATGSIADNDLSIYAISNNDSFVLTANDTTTISNFSADGIKIKIINTKSSSIKIKEFLVNYG